MKKLILKPSKDTITICLPEDWVGKFVSCILQKEEEEDIISEMKEPDTEYDLSLGSILDEIWSSEMEDEVWKDI